MQDREISRPSVTNKAFAQLFAHYTPQKKPRSTFQILGSLHGCIDENVLTMLPVALFAVYTPT
jgi:hypothetical protein